MDIVIAAMGMILFGTIGGFLFVSIPFVSKKYSSASELLKGPRFIGGCICLVLTVLCGCAML